MECQPRPDCSSAPQLPWCPEQPYDEAYTQVLYCTVLYCTVLYCTVLYTQGDCARGELLLPENFALGSRPCPATFSCHQDFHHQLDSIKNESNPLRQDELSFIQADLQVMFDNAHTTEAITWHKYTLS